MKPPAIPAMGYGTFPLQGDDARTAVATAIEVGFRHVDTAQWYGNESEVGDGVAASSVPHDELFVVTKVHPDRFADGSCLDSARRSRDRLRLERVDLLLAHWPPKGVTTESVIDNLTACREEGLTRWIGVSNFNVPMLERAARHACVPIVTNQVEFHPLLDQSRLLGCARALGITLTAYCPLGRGEALQDPVVWEVAERTGRTPAQVVLRWIVQQGVAAISMSTRRANMEANLAVLDFTLRDSDMALITARNAAGRRIVDLPELAPDWDA